MADETQNPTGTDEAVTPETVEVTPDQTTQPVETPAEATTPEPAAEGSTVPVEETPAPAEEPAPVADEQEPALAEPEPEAIMEEGESASETEPAQESAVEVTEAEKGPQALYPEIQSGVTIRVHQKIKDVTAKGEKERIQIFEGMVIGRHGKDAIHTTITVRKISSGIGVEKIYPLNMPAIEKIEIVKKHKVRRAQAPFLRNYTKRLKEIRAPKAKKSA